MGQLNTTLRISFFPLSIFFAISTSPSRVRRDDRSHFPEIHPHGVRCSSERLHFRLFAVILFLFENLLFLSLQSAEVFHDVDVHLVKHHQDIIDLIGGDDIIGRDTIRPRRTA